MPRPRVFVPEYDPKKNLTPAEAFGDLVYLLDYRETGPGLIHNGGLNRMDEQLQGITSSDYLVLVGDPAAIGVMCCIAALLTGGRLNVLKWDRQEHTYTPLRLRLTAFEGLDVR